MSKIIIYELDMSGGTCGFPAPIPGQPPVNKMRNELIRRSRITKRIRSELGIEVDRVILKNISFLDNEIVKDYLNKEGRSAFPVFLYKEKIIYSGDFPDFEVLHKLLKC